MAWDSAYTAQLNGGFQGMAMNQMAYAQQIGMGGLSGMPGPASQQVMGGMMNRAQAIGAPLMQGAMGMMGIDPMSLGLNAGMRAFGAGSGLMGAGLAGMGVAGAAAGGMALAGYGANQMFTGAQQQMSLNGALRGGFNFTNQMTGQQGFSSGQSGQIGGMMREMTHHFGPGGEVMGMGELTSLASNMGRMGMGNQVRDVQDFGKKFREMVQTLKSVATEMGTSLQEAQQFVSSIRGSGIFNKADQLKYASTAKGMAFAGGMALSEVTAMGNIGAQISRSVGGLGRQGSFAGMNTIGQIGVAQQMGILSDEDVYNATGQYGAEGRQALATSSLQQSANFLRGGKGRRMLASLAGSNGSLDEGSVQELLSGGMTISETMKNAHSNLGKVGRANFLRNEGRLRGAAMEKLGGFLPAMQLREWLQGKGMDVDEMDDRTMLFAQRQLGMGRDEMDSAMKMAQGMPQILQQMKSANQDKVFMDRLGEQRKSQGMEGIKNRFNQARERVQGTLQQIGQEIFSAGSEQIEEFMNHLAGTYEQRFSKEAENAFRQSSLGGKAAGGIFKTLTGQGARFGSSASSVFGNAQGASNFFDERGGMGGAPGGRSALDWLLKGDSMESKYKKAGYDTSAIGNMRDPAKQQAALNDRLRGIADIARAANEPPSSAYLALGAQNAGWLGDAYGNGTIAGNGEERMKSFEAALMVHGSPAAKEAWNKASSPAEKARIMSAMRGGALGGKDPSQVLAEARAEAGKFALPGGDNDIFAGATTAGERQRILATKLTGESGPDSLGAALLQGGKYGAVAGALMGGVGAIPGAIAGAIGRGAKYLMNGSPGQANRAMAADLDTDATTKNISALMSSDKDVREAARSKTNSELARLQDKEGTRDSVEEGRLLSLKRQMAAADVLAAGGANASKEELEKIAAKYKLEGGSEGALSNFNVLGANEGRKAREVLLGLGKRFGDEGVSEMSRISGIGVAKFEGGKVTISKDVEGKLGKSGSAYLQAMYQSTSLLAQLQNEKDPDRIVALMNQAQASQQSATGMLQGMSVTQQRELAKTLTGEGDFAGAGAVLESARRHEQFGRDMGRKGVGGAAAGALGLHLSKDKLAALQKMKDPSKIAAVLAGELGADDPAVRADIEAAVKGAGGKGGVGASADILASVSGLKSVQDASKKKRDDQAAEKDPLLAKVATSTEAMAKTLTTISNQLGGTLSVDDKGGTEDQPGGAKKP